MGTPAVLLWTWLIVQGMKLRNSRQGNQVFLVCLQSSTYKRNRNTLRSAMVRTDPLLQTGRIPIFGVLRKCSNDFRRWGRLRGMERGLICRPMNSGPKHRPKKKPPPSKKYVFVEFTTRQYEGSPALTTLDGPIVSFVESLEAATLPPKVHNAGPAFVVSIPKAIEQATDNPKHSLKFVGQSTHRPGRKRVPGRTLAMEVNDESCPSSLNPMVICPKCGAHFRISVSITPLKNQSCGSWSCKDKPQSAFQKRDQTDDLDHQTVQKLGSGAPETAACSMSNLGTMMICPRCSAILTVGVHVHESPFKPWPPSAGDKSTGNGDKNDDEQPFRGFDPT